MGGINLSVEPKKTRGRNILFGIVTLVTFLGCAEIFLRLFMPLHFVSSNQAYQYDPEVGFRPKPGHTLIL